MACVVGPMDVACDSLAHMELKTSKGPMLRPTYSAIFATLCIIRSGCRPSHKSTHLWLLLRS